MSVDEIMALAEKAINARIALTRGGGSAMPAMTADKTLRAAVTALVAERDAKADQIVKLLVEIEAFGKALLKAEAERDALKAARPEVVLQGGLNNDELREALDRKLPGQEPKGQELTTFAIGVEVGAEMSRVYFDERNSARDAWRRAADERDALRVDADKWKAINMLWHFPGKTLEEVLHMRAAELEARSKT